MAPSAVTYRGRCEGRRERVRSVAVRRVVREYLEHRRRLRSLMVKRRSDRASWDAFWREQGALGKQSGPGWQGSIGGACPVQGFGTVDGLPWYFRARGTHWDFAVAPAAEGDPVDQMFPSDVPPFFCRHGDYGETYEASWMDASHAWAIIKRCLNEFRNPPRKGRRRE